MWVVGRITSMSWKNRCGTGCGNKIKLHVNLWGRLNKEVAMM